MDLQQYLHALRTYWWAVAIPLVLGIGLGALLAARDDPQHRASVTFFVATSPGTEGVSAVQGDEFAQRRVNSYLELLSTDRLATKVIEASGADLTAGQVTAMMDADAPVDTVLLTATVTHESRALVEQVAGAVATELVALVDEVENPDGNAAQAQLDVVSGPNVTEVQTRTALTVGVPGALGLLIGLGLAWFLELRDNKIRSEAHLHALDAGPVLAVIPTDRRLREPFAGRLASTAGTESFRQLRTNLEFVDLAHPVRLLVVTSPLADEGKSTTCANLALAFAVAGKRVLIVQGDLRRPDLDDLLPARRGPGLTDLVIGRANVGAALQSTDVQGLAVLPSGPHPPNPSELLGSNAMAQLLDSLRDRFDLVVVNTPPLLPVTDAAVLAAHADGVLLVVRCGATTRQELAQARRSLTAVDARVVGTVLNGAPARRDPAYAAYWETPQSNGAAPDGPIPQPGWAGGPGHGERQGTS